MKNQKIIPFTFINKNNDNGIIIPFILNTTYVVNSSIDTNYSYIDPTEMWREVKSLRVIAPNYVHLVSNKGNVKRYHISYPSDIEDVRVETDVKYGHKYFKIILSTGDKRYIKIHHIVAEAFIPKPSEDCEWVGHVDKNKSNNKVENLKWIVKFKNENTNTGKGIIAKDRVTGEEVKFNSINEASKTTGINKNRIRKLCEKRDSAFGYYWKYGY